MSLLAIPNTFVAGNTITAAGHNQNMAAIAAWAAGNIGQDNLDTLTGTVSFLIASNTLGLSMVNSGTEGLIRLTNNANLASGKAVLQILQNATGPAFEVLSSSGGAISITQSGAGIPLNITKTGAGPAVKVVSTSAGVLFPVMTTTQRDAIGTPDTGLEIYNSTTLQKEVYNGTSWTGNRPSIATKTANYTATITDDSIFCNADSSSSFTVTLPAAASIVGKILKIRKTGSDITKTVTVDGNASETIDGATTFVLYTKGETIEIQSDGSNWQILDHQTLTNWSSSLSFTPNSTPFGTVSNVSFLWKRVGDTMHVKGFFTMGTVTGNAGKVALPVTIDTSKVIAGACRESMGTWFSIDGTAGVTAFGASSRVGAVEIDTSDSSNIYFAKAGSVGLMQKSDGNTLGGNGDSLSIRFEIPVSGWVA